MKSKTMWKQVVTIMLVMISLVCALFVGGCGQQTEKAKPAMETRVVTDQLGRQVTIPKEVKRIVVLQHHTLDLLLELQAGDKIVGAVNKWQELVSPELGEIYPPLKKMPTPGDLKDINVEELVKLHPDVVIVTSYISKDVIAKVEKVGIPVVAVSYYKADKEEASKINPNLKNPDKAFTEGFVEGVKLIGTIANKEAKAQELIDYTLKNREFVNSHLASATATEKKPRVYMANPEMSTYGTGKYVGVMMEKAGVENVAAADVKGFAKVTMEQIAAWNPEIIFVQSRYKSLADEIKTSPAWAGIAAVQKGQVVVAPEYAKPWGNPCPESMALGELWLAKTFHPDLFADVDMKAKANEFYTQFYGVPYKGE